MSDSTATESTGEGGMRLPRRDQELRARFEHLRALNSAWGVLAPFGLSDEGQHIVETGRALSADLAQLASQEFERRDRSGLPKLDKLLDAIEGDLRALAFEVPVAQLRSALPSRLPSERRGVLDLLDLMLAAESEGHDGLAGRISAIDYLITLLCIGGPAGDGSVLQDPVGLTPRLHALCERADDDDDPRLAEIAAEFYAAADVNEVDVREEIQLRSLRRRKRELGASFFAPRVLRAIVTYNAALSRCIHRGVFDSRDWGSLLGVVELSGADASVFETEVLPRIAEALRRRVEGAAPSSSAIDRVAWCLDLAALDEGEHAALTSPAVGLPGDLEGTAILVGLLCRSAVVLEGEFPAIGISPERLSSEWIRELDEALKREVNRRIASDAYEQACILSELRTRFLYSLVTPLQRPQRRPERQAEPSSFEQVEQEARDLASEAVAKEKTKSELAGSTAWKEWRSWQWARVVRLSGAGAALGLLAWILAQVFLLGGDLDRLAGDELDRVSSYLARGARNGEGQGPAFVGTLDDAWFQLPANEREQAAQQMVQTLRAGGVREIMIYDGERRLRIQALGEQPVHVVPDLGP